MSGVDAGLRLARVVQHLGDAGRVAAGQQLDGLARAGLSGSHAAPEDAAALAGLAGGGVFFHPLHGKGQGQGAFAGRGGQFFKQRQQRGALVAAPAGLVRVGGGHVPAHEGGDGHDGGGLYARFLREGLQRIADVGKGGGRLRHGVELVDGKDDGGHAQQVREQGVAARLRQQRGQGGLPVDFGGVYQHYGSVGLAGGGDHVARVLLVAGGVADDEFARFGGEVAPGHVDGDALLALGLQAVGEQGQVGLAAAGDAGQVVLQHGAAVQQQAANEGAFAVVHAAAGDKAQGGAGGAGVSGRGCGGGGCGRSHGCKGCEGWMKSGGAGGLERVRLERRSRLGFGQRRGRGCHGAARRKTSACAHGRLGAASPGAGADGPAGG